MAGFPGLFAHPAGAAAHAALPLIVSASRATDLPAFHGEWFMNRLRAGYCARVNPFNGKAHRIAFSRCRAFVFWSKNPAPFLAHLDEISGRGFEFYFNFTLNDYEAEGLERNLPPLRRRLETFAALAGRVGPERVIWRFDPIALGPGLGPDEVLARIERLGRELSPCTEKMVFSFVEIAAYKKVRGKLRAGGWREPDEAERLYMAGELARINASWPRPLALASCAQEIDLAPYGIIRNKCVDGELLLRLRPGDADLRQLAAKKDPGQRKACGCAPSRDVGAYDSCGHLCAYCYALASASGGNMARGGPDRERL